ncbi:MAG: hypothetical protein HN867_13155 [Deltaproteobacteria bacterium]|jgi:hypothetical protein|nr:hypothetical protein [Deltaproteobacteria bacterium]MBT7204414.1 hypothetical protein [Deltaproteobacteria bacterium]
MKENLASLTNSPTTSRQMDQDSLTREYIDSLRSEITELRRQLQTSCTEKNQLLQLFLGQASSLQASLNPVVNQPSVSPPVQRTKPLESADDLQGSLPIPTTAPTVGTTSVKTPPPKLTPPKKEKKDEPIWQPVRRAKAFADEVPVPLLVRRYVQEVNNHRIPIGHAELRPMWEWLQWQGMVLDRQNRESARETLKRMRKQLKN